MRGGHVARGVDPTHDILCSVYSVYHILKCMIMYCNNNNV